MIGEILLQRAARDGTAIGNPRPAGGRRRAAARPGAKRPKAAPNDPERPKTDRTGPDAPPARYAARAARRTAEAEPGRARESLSRPIRRTPHDLPARRAARARVVT
ncbi:hypothetical protein EYA88_18150 [Burkholderia pseudomallei]|uniref:hypothetical protein n=1 Tax=Burkholderia pseudomallei TaxID=28450 RepID=UPI001053539F|nr:hypothetical protein [Burkholderia pseudomallei]QBL86405.1 hypothetical protein EYA88_18150 [Burkholderia pseudomallei]